MVQNGGSLRCQKCFKRCSYLKGTFFEQLKLPISKILELGYYWLNNIRVTSLRNMGGISNQTSCSYFEKFEDLVSTMIENENIKIGGPGIIVEIDESKFGKRKYNRGHRVIGSWVIGGVERTDEKKFFAISVTSRDKDLIKTVLVDHVLPGTIIYTDGWKAYDGAISELNKDLNMNYEHHVVNHSETFVAPDGTCTNGIEGNWNGVKYNLTGRQMCSSNIDKKLLTFIWRRQNYKDLWSAFLQALADVIYE